MFKRKFSLVGELRNSSVGNNKFGGRGHPMNNTLSLRVSGVSQVVLVVKNLPAKAGDTRDAGLIPGLGRSPGEGNGNLLQYSCLGESHGQKSLAGYNHGITKSRTRLSTQTTAPSFRLTEGQDLG